MQNHTDQNAPAPAVPQPDSAEPRDSDNHITISFLGKRTSRTNSNPSKKRRKVSEELISSKETESEKASEQEEGEEADVRRERR